VAVDGSGDFVVVWHSEGSSGDDASSFSIQGQRYRVPGVVGDRVWLDRDLDGLQDAGEPGLPGIGVHLYEDPAMLVGSTTTDGAGLFQFEDGPGSYYLEFELPSIYSFTLRDQGGNDSVDSDADPVTGETDTFVIVSAANDASWDAGMANGIGDFVWLDGNGNGVQDGGELGIGGIVVELRTATAVLVATTVTGSDGHYALPELEAGVYSLKFVPPPGSTFTVQDNIENDDTLDSDVDPVTGTTPFFLFSLGAIDLDWDAGLSTYTAGIFSDGFESGNTSAWSTAAP
jgi:hypothetical protein